MRALRYAAVSPSPSGCPSGSACRRALSPGCWHRHCWSVPLSASPYAHRGGPSPPSAATSQQPSTLSPAAAGRSPRRAPAPVRSTPPGADIKEAGVSTWGGGFLQRTVGGEHHSFVSEFVGNCGVTAWQTNSQIVRFSSPSPRGPWKRNEVSLPLWAHCGSAAVAPNGTVVMWSFRGSKKPRMGLDPQGQRCIAGATPCGFAKHGCNTTHQCQAKSGGWEPCPPPAPPEGSGCSSWGKAKVMIILFHIGVLLLCCICHHIPRPLQFRVSMGEFYPWLPVQFQSQISQKT